MIRVVIDTNVLVSGLLSPRGNEALILLAVNQGFVRPCLSTAILKEYTEVLARPKFGFAPDELSAVMGMFRDKGNVVDPAGDVPGLPDPSDAIFILCAAAAQADYLVTGNKRHFPPQACGAVRVVNAAELLDWITLEI